MKRHKPPIKIRLLYLTLTALSNCFVGGITLAHAEATFLKTHAITNDFETFFKAARDMEDVCKSQPVLLAFDLDNTLLEMNEDLGSEQWFDWQSGLLADPNPYKMVKNFPDLLALDTATKAVIGMHLSEDTLPALLSDSQHQTGIQTIVLSSRGPEQAPSTLRELKNNGLHFEAKTLPSLGADAKMPYDLNHLTDEGLSAEDVTTLKLGKPRPVSFDEGVYSTSGQNKGAMLRVLLHKESVSPCAIVFIDNKEQYSTQMLDAFKNENVNVITFRYSRTDHLAQDFAKAPKEPVMARWKALIQN